jgi:hypothetical protein
MAAVMWLVSCLQTGVAATRQRGDVSTDVTLVVADARDDLPSAQMLGRWAHVQVAASEAEAAARSTWSSDDDGSGPRRFPAPTLTFDAVEDGA